MSRGGYMMIEDKIMEQDFQALLEASTSDPTIVVEPPAPPPRHRKWKEGRKRDGKYLNDNIAVVASKIVSS